MQKLFRVTVDISKKIPAPAFEVNTNDLKSVKLEITITNGQSLLDLTDVTPRINIRKPDNEVIFQDCEIVGATAGKVQIVLENQAYLVPGTHTAEIACYKGNEITAITGTFSYKSVKGIMNDKAVESKSEFTAINRTIQEAERILEDLRENGGGGGAGVDQQARQEIEGLTEQLAEIEQQLEDGTAGIDDEVVSENKVWSSLKVKEQIQTIPKGEKGDKGDPGTASIAIDDNATNASQTWSSSKIQDQLKNTVPPDNSIKLRNLTFLPVVGTPSKNLFNKEVMILNKALSASNGQLTDVPDWFVSDFIPVKPNTRYTLRPNVTNSFAIAYDEAKTFISQVGRDILTPANAKYLRFTITASSLEATQLEEGEVFTGYEAFGAKVTKEQIKDETLPGTVLSQKSIPVNRITDIVMGKNLFNKDTVTDGYFAGNTTGLLYPNSGYCVSDFIPIKSSSPYTRSFVDQIAFYAEDMKTYVGGSTNTSVATITSPSAAKYMRVSIPKTQKDTYQIEEGDRSTSYQPYQYEFKYLKKEAVQSTEYKRLYSFKDAWVAWESGEKFPIGFLGDSTTDGTGTSAGAGHEAQDNNAGGYGKVDYINKKAYPYLLEQLIKSETGKTQPRIYNIGYSGTRFDWVRPKINDIMGGVYSDTKMIGIQYGINDRLNAGVTTKMYEQEMREHLEFFVDYFYKKGIQPFIVTSQATVEPSPETTETIHPMRSTEAINSVANRVKRDIARKYNLEIMELTDFDEHLLTYSQYSLSQLINDRLHFGDIGHSIEAGYLFSYLCPRVIKITDDTRLGFTSQRMKSRVPGDLIQYVNPFEDGFKVKANYTKSDTNDLLIQDFWVLNYSKKQFNLKAFVTTPGAQHVKLNDVDTVITANGQSLGNLDIGLHHIQAFTGASDKVDFKGFTLN